MKDRLKQIRKEYKLTQAEFGNRVGLKQNTIAAYECGKLTPSDTVVNNICKEYGLNESWFRTGEGQPYVDLTKKAKLARFFGEVMTDENESFRIRFFEALASYSPDDWKMLEIILSKMSIAPVMKRDENSNENKDNGEN